MSKQKVAEYELYKRIKLLGEGAFGKAYLVECLQDKSIWVIKYMDMNAMSKSEREDTVKEARILEFLKHPNIVNFREVYTTKGGKLCIVMEHADGGDLSKKIRDQRGQYFSENQILDWFTQICLAIKHVHDRKIIHRDLKGQNIFLTSKGQIKLGDFGIARVLKNTVEKAKTMVGTPYYISPEIIEGKAYSMATDIWSLGVILYELCALKPPFNAESLHFLALKIVKGQYTPVPAHYSRELRNLVAMLLSTESRRRPSIHEILKQPVIVNRIKGFLSESIRHQEFAHTILHRQVFDPKANLNNINVINKELPCPPQLLQEQIGNLQQLPQIKQNQIQQQQQLQKNINGNKSQPNQIEPKPLQPQNQIKSQPDSFQEPIVPSPPMLMRPPSLQQVEKNAINPSRPQSNAAQKPPQQQKPSAPQINQKQIARPQSSQQQQLKRPESKRLLEQPKKIISDKSPMQKERPKSNSRQVAPVPPQQNDDQKRMQQRINNIKQEQQKKQDQEIKLEQQKRDEYMMKQNEKNSKAKIVVQEIPKKQVEKVQEIPPPTKLNSERAVSLQELDQPQKKEQQQQRPQSKPENNQNKLQEQQQMKKKPTSIQKNAVVVEKIQEKNKEFELMLSELESIINGVNNVVKQLPEQDNKNYFDIQTQIMQKQAQDDDREDDLDEPDDKPDPEKNKNQQAPLISTEEEEGINAFQVKDIPTLRLSIEKILGPEKFQKAYKILKEQIDNYDLDIIEKKHGPSYSTLLPFLSDKERKKYVPLILTYIITNKSDY